MAYPASVQAITSSDGNEYEKPSFPCPRKDKRYAPFLFPFLTTSFGGGSEERSALIGGMKVKVYFRNFTIFSSCTITGHMDSIAF